MFKPGDKIIVDGMVVKAERRYIGHSSDGLYVVYEYKTDYGHIMVSTVRASRAYPAPVQKEGWINIYKLRATSSTCSLRVTGSIFDTEEEAIKRQGPNRVATVKIEWEETP